MQIEQQSQITREKENFPPHILKEIPTNNIFKSLFNDDKSAKAAAGKKYITPKQLLTAGKTRSSRKRQQPVRNCRFAFASMYIL